MIIRAMFVLERSGAVAPQVHSILLTYKKQGNVFILELPKKLLCPLRVSLVGDPHHDFVALHQGL